MLGFELQVVEAAQYLEARQHAIDAVEPPAGGLRVQMAAGHHRWQRVVAAGATGKDVAHLVDPDAATGLLAPAHEDIPPLPVQIGQRQAAVPSLLRRADPGHLHQAVPQPFSVDPQVAAGKRLSHAVPHLPDVSVAAHAPPRSKSIRRLRIALKLSWQITRWDDSGNGTIEASPKGRIKETEGEGGQDPSC